MFNSKQVVKVLQQERTQRVAELQMIGEAIAILSGSGRKNNVVEMPKRQISAAGRRRIAKAQRNRWAKAKAEKAQPKKKKAIHWTQRPENRARVQKMLRRATRIRMSA